MEDVIPTLLHVQIFILFLIRPHFTCLNSEIDNDVYCVCTHDISLCTHTKFRHVRTMYAVKFSGTQTVFGFMRTQLKYLSENRDKNEKF